MPSGLRRHQSCGDLHAVNINCFRKQAIFDTAESCATFLRILEETRARYAFSVIAYVVMPTHVHLLLSEPESSPLSTAVQVFKQRFSRTRVLEEQVWERRYYDFNIFSGRKLAEKVHYIHMNPVHAGLAATPADWAWSSYRAHVFGESGPVTVVEPPRLS
jgi:putative transposase